MIAAVSVVRETVTASPEPVFDGATVSVKVPRDGTPPTPFFLVRAEGNFPGASPASERASIRVSVWHDSEDLGLDAASLLRSRLLSYSGGSGIRSFGRLTGPIPSEDPESGRPLTFFTVAARLRPINL